MSRRWLILLGAIAAVLLIIAVVSYSLLTKAPEVEPPPVTAPPPQPPHETKSPSEPPPESLEQRIESLKKEVQAAGAAGKAAEVTITITEDEANSKIAPLLMETEIPEDLPLEIESVQFDFQTDIMVTTLTATFHGITVTSEVEAQVNIRDGRPEVEITDIDFGWLPLPEFIKRQLTSLIMQKIEELQADTLEREIASAIGDVDWSITGIDIEETQATVSLVIQPKTARE